MAKQAYVYSGTDWVPLASEVTNLSNYYTKGEIDILDAPTGLKLLVPISVAVGSGTGTVGATGTVTFSGASSVSLNGCFTSAYSNYKIVMYSTNSAGSQILKVRVRASGTDLSSGTYNYNAYYANSATSGFGYLDFGNNQTAASISYNGVKGNSVSLDIFNPQVADYTHMSATGSFSDSSNTFTLLSGAFVNNTTAYDGITFYPAANNFTGTVSVYGYKK